jgi:hypothetical protein
MNLGNERPIFYFFVSLLKTFTSSHIMWIGTAREGCTLRFLYHSNILQTIYFYNIGFFNCSSLSQDTTGHQIKSLYDIRKPDKSTLRKQGEPQPLFFPTLISSHASSFQCWTKRHKLRPPPPAPFLFRCRNSLPLLVTRVTSSSCPKSTGFKAESIFFQVISAKMHSRLGQRAIRKLEGKSLFGRVLLYFSPAILYSRQKVRMQHRRCVSPHKIDIERYYSQNIAN